MRRRYNKRSRGIHRRRSLKSTNAGPILKLIGVIVAALAVLALIVFVAVPRLLPLLGIDYNMPWEPTPTPTPTPAPTPTPHPVSVVDPVDLQTEVVLSGHTGYEWFADPYAYGDTLYFVAGHLVDGDIRMDAMFALDMDTGEHEELTPTLENYSYVSPVCNDKWLVYLDSKAEGGGCIRAKNLLNGTERIVKEFYVGQPQLHLDGDILAWVERTGSRMDKLFAADLITLENTTVRMFNNTPYGQSGISLRGGELIYAFEGTAEASSSGEEASGIYSLRVADGGTADVYHATTYVHDPLTNGTQWVWRNGLHGETDVLYWTDNKGEPKKLVENVIDYGISSTFVAYSKDEQVFIYLFADGKHHAVTPDPKSERAQLLGVSNGVVIWMDVTSRDREVMKFARIEQG